MIKLISKEIKKPEKVGPRMFNIKTEHPFCVDSMDYKDPCGAKHDYNVSPRFTSHAHVFYRRPISVLDLGCANGSQVVHFLEKGFCACGIDGSDYGLKNQTGGWKSHPDFFLNADISKPFQVYNDEYGDVHFDVITAWEVFEHIQEKDLPQLMYNIKTHIHQTSLCFFSIALFDSPPYHQTVKPEVWWRDFFSEWIIQDEIMLWMTIRDSWLRLDEPSFKRLNIVLSPTSNMNLPLA